MQFDPIEEILEHEMQFDLIEEIWVFKDCYTWGWFGICVAMMEVTFGLHYRIWKL